MTLTLYGLCNKENLETKSDLARIMRLGPDLWTIHARVDQRFNLA